MLTEAANMNRQAPAIHPVCQVLCWGIGTAVGAGITAAVGAGTAAIFSNPIGAAGAATYSAIGFLMGRTVQLIQDKAFGVEDTKEFAANINGSACKKIAYVICGLVSAVGCFIASVNVANSMGVAITFKGALILGLQSAGLVLAGFLTLAIVAGIAMAILSKNPNPRVH